jgi:hypothetical protein
MDDLPPMLAAEIMHNPFTLEKLTARVNEMLKVPLAR